MRLVRVDSLEPGAMLGEPLFDAFGRLLLADRVPMTPEHIAHLRAMGIAAIYLYEADTSDIQISDPVRPEVRAKALLNLSSCFSLVSTGCEVLRADSAGTARQNLASGRFADTLRSLSESASVSSMFKDVDNMIDDLMRQDVLVGLNSIKSHDSYTFQHSIDVTIMALLLARKAGWDRGRLRAFGIGCILHDVGKIFVHPEVLNKPAKLTKEEYEEVKTHPALGYELVKLIGPGLGVLAPHVAYQHHERQDGTGYPRGLKGTNRLGENPPKMIHDFGAVAAVADVYDAMSSDRPYRAGWPADRVCKFIRENSGTHLNREAVGIFESVVAPYPLATEVKVLSGRYAQHRGVVAHVFSAKLERPRVRVLYDATGRRIDPQEIDLRIQKDVLIESVGPGEGWKRRVA